MHKSMDRPLEAPYVILDRFWMMKPDARNSVRWGKLCTGIQAPLAVLCFFVGISQKLAEKLLVLHLFGTAIGANLIFWTSGVTGCTAELIVATKKSLLGSLRSTALRPAHF